MQTILVGISSGIAAFKAITLVKNLKKRGYNVIVIMTENAKKMISVKEFEEASGNKVASELFPKGFSYKEILKKRKVEHINLADKASVICVVPATANIVGKVANGICDDLLSTTIIASKANLIFCPSMNVNMWNNPKFKKNLDSIKKMGALVIDPEKGELACGYEGKGRLTEINFIEDEIVKAAERKKEFSGKNVLVTAGGTEEEIDDVRVITNKSSGKMGIKIAEEFAKRGAEVTLIKARTEIESSITMNEIKVKSSQDMFKEIKKNIKRNGIVVHAAAVGDYTLSKKKGKIKSGSGLVLELSPNIKLIDQIKKIKKDVFLVGFKAEHGAKELERRAYSTLQKCHANLFVANDISKKVFGSDYNEVIIVDEFGKTKKIKRNRKEFVAEKIVDEVKKRI